MRVSLDLPDPFPPSSPSLLEFFAAEAMQAIQHANGQFWDHEAVAACAVQVAKDMLWVRDCDTYPVQPRSRAPSGGLAFWLCLDGTAITWRDWVAARAMKGMLGRRFEPLMQEAVAIESWKQADSLLAELAKAEREEILPV